jgi:hypothetical protein
LIKFDAVCSRLLNRSLIIPIGSVPVISSKVDVDVTVGAVLGGSGTDGFALSSVEVTAGDEGVVVCVVLGCVAPGTGEADGVAVWEDWILSAGFLAHIFELKGWTTKDDRFFLSIAISLSIIGSVEGTDPVGFFGRVP